MFYETKHPIKSDYFKIESGENYNFPPHIHSHFELITVIDGEMSATVDGKEYRLQKGMGLLIFPNQIHALISKKNNRHILCIFSPELIKAFSGNTLGKIPVNNSFLLPSFYTERLIAGNFDTIMAKGFLYSVCGEFNKTAEYSEQKGSSAELLYRIFAFVEENRNKECSLVALADSISYDYAYISKYFKKMVGISFCDYVNAYRLGDACYLLQNTEKPITDIAFLCGYTSLRSFNRNFKQNFGITPKQYRTQK